MSSEWTSLAVNRGRIWFEVTIPEELGGGIFSVASNGTAAGYFTEDSVYLTRQIGPNPDWVRLKLADLEGTDMLPEGFSLPTQPEAAPPRASLGLTTGSELSLVQPPKEALHVCPVGHPRQS